MKRGVSVGDFLKPLDECRFQAYLSDALQVPDILEWILDQTGKAEVIQTSFSISEEYLRRLEGIRRKGLVSSLDLILDFKATNKTVDLWLFISRVANRAFLAQNHSKIILVKGLNGMKVVVITSQNLTRGNRNESAFIGADDLIYDTLKAQVDIIINDNSIFLNDILSGTDRQD